MPATNLSVRRHVLTLLIPTLFLAASGAWLVAQSDEHAGKSGAASSAEPQPTRIPTPEEIQQALSEKARRTGGRVIMPVDHRPGGPPEADVTSLTPNNIRPQSVKLLPEGTRIVDRPGRLVRDGDHWAFAFETRTEGPAELPMRLLPNRNLEDMEMLTENGQKPAVFLLSGEVTEYHGINYLLIQKVLNRTDLGNLQ